LIVGIDVHKHNHAAALIDDRGGEIATLIIPNAPKGCHACPRQTARTSSLHTRTCANGCPQRRSCGAWTARRTCSATAPRRRCCATAACSRTCLKGEPFEHVMHGMVTQDGRKMGKHLGNVADPDDLLDRCGADTLRFAMLHVAAPAHRYRLVRGRHRAMPPVSPATLGLRPPATDVQRREHRLHGCSPEQAQTPAGEVVRRRDRQGRRRPPLAADAPRYAQRHAVAVLDRRLRAPHHRTRRRTRRCRPRRDEGGSEQARPTARTHLAARGRGALSSWV
jgi:hypothetical protein